MSDPAPTSANAVDFALDPAACSEGMMGPWVERFYEVFPRDDSPLPHVADFDIHFVIDGVHRAVEVKKFARTPSQQTLDTAARHKLDIARMMAPLGEETEQEAREFWNGIIADMFVERDFITGKIPAPDREWMNKVKRFCQRQIAAVHSGFHRLEIHLTVMNGQVTHVAMRLVICVAALMARLRSLSLARVMKRSIREQFDNRLPPPPRRQFEAYFRVVRRSNIGLIPAAV